LDCDKVRISGGLCGVEKLCDDEKDGGNIRRKTGGRTRRNPSNDTR